MEQLDGYREAACACRDEQDIRGADTLRDRLHCTRCLGENVECPLRQLCRREHRSLELGREHPRRCDSHSLEPFSAGVECPHERHVGTRHRLRGVGERTERF
jgi:hypothetical protein